MCFGLVSERLRTRAQFKLKLRYSRLEVLFTAITFRVTCTFHCLDVGFVWYKFSLRADIDQAVPALSSRRQTKLNIACCVVRTKDGRTNERKHADRPTPTQGDRMERMSFPTQPGSPLAFDESVLCIAHVAAYFD